MKKFTVHYTIGAYHYESTVNTSSSGAALFWIEAIGGYNGYVVKEEELE
jgi:hypothetical protein